MTILAAVGESLLQNVLDDPLLALGRENGLLRI